MPVNMTTAISALPDSMSAGSKAVTSKNNTTESFRDMLQTALRDVNESQLKADATVTSFLTGEVQDVHTVMLALGEAKLTMQLAVEVRNKVVEAYQELSRMQI